MQNRPLFFIRFLWERMCHLHAPLLSHFLNSLIPNPNSLAQPRVALSA